MINVNFLLNKDEEILGFKIKGHAGLKESGKDIVCAAVSSCVYMVINTLTEICFIKPSLLVKHDGFINFKILKEDFYKCKELLLGFKIHIVSLSKVYCKNIIVNYTEV